MQVFATNDEYLSNIQVENKYQIGDPRVICKILSDSLYSNKIGSIIRELSANAIDAHKDNGKENVPFDVHLPGHCNGLFNGSDRKYFSIRDYGKGLTEVEMISIYTIYGGSTKRTTNDFIGGFGIGSKSPFAYSNQFEVVSYNNGKKQHYICYINNEAYPCITKVEDVETNEPSGLEVIVNIANEDDCNQFNFEAIKQYSYYDVRPNCNIELPDLVPYIKTKDYCIYTKTQNEKAIDDCFRKYTKTSYFFYSDSFINFHNYTSKVFVKMNNYIYSIPDDIMKKMMEIQDLRGILYSGLLILNADIASCDINASREDIAVTDKSIDTIVRLYTKFIDSFFAELVKKYEGKTDYDIFYDFTYHCLMTTGTRTLNHTFTLSKKEKRIYDLMCYGLKFDVKHAIQYLSEKKIRFYDLEKANKNVLFRQGYKSDHYYANTYKKNAIIGVDAYFIQLYGSGYDIKLYFLNKGITNKTAKFFFEHYDDFDYNDINHIFFVDTDEEIEEIKSWYSGAQAIVVTGLKNPKKETGNKKGSVASMQYYLFSSSSMKHDYRYFLCNLRYNIRYSSEKISEPYDVFANNVKNSKNIIFVLDNCKLVDSYKLKSYVNPEYANLDYQMVLCNLLNCLKISNMTKINYNIIMMNIENYKKYLNNREKYGYPLLNDEYAKNKALEILKDYIPNINVTRKLLKDVLTVYMNNIQDVVYLLDIIPPKYLTEHNNVAFFNALEKLKIISGDVYDKCYCLDMLAQIFNVKKDDEDTQWFNDYMADNPILKILSNERIVSYNYKIRKNSGDVELIKRTLDKYIFNK